MEFQNVIDARKMVRSFLPDPLSDEQIQQLVKNMLSGPSAGFSQGTELVVLTETESRSRFFQQWGDEEERAPYRNSWPHLEQAPVIILVCANETRYQQRYAAPDKNGLAEDGMPWWYIDSGMAALLGLLTAVDQGLVATFTGIKSQNYLRETYNIPDHIDVIGAVLVGYQQGEYRPSASVKQGRRQTGDIVHYQSW